MMPSSELPASFPQQLEISGSRYEETDEAWIATIASGFASNTMLRHLQLNTWLEADLAPVLTALQRHPALKKLHLRRGCSSTLPSLSGLEGFLRSQDSKVEVVVLEQVESSTDDLNPVIQELRRNSTVMIHLDIRHGRLSS
jgi:hypothetical protein